MSGGKTKEKKKKRGVRGEALDFVSPLTEKECIDHLNSSRSNLPFHNLIVHTDGSQFEGEFVGRGFFGRSAPVWFVGRLDQHPAGTRVTGNIVRGYGTSRLGLVIQQAVALGGLLYFFVVGMGHVTTTTESRGWFALCVLLLLVVLAIFTINRRLFNGQANALLAWVTDRLDIQR